MYCSYNWSDCCNECKQKNYFDDWDDGSFAEELRTSIEELLLAYQVDMFLAGHVHAYERMWPVYASIVDKSSHSDLYINPRYPVHVMCGSAGNMEGSKCHSKSIEFHLLKLDFLPPVGEPPSMQWQPPVTVQRMVRYGFAVMSMYGAEEILWQVWLLYL